MNEKRRKCSVDQKILLRWNRRRAFNNIFFFGFTRLSQFLLKVGLECLSSERGICSPSLAPLLEYSCNSETKADGHGLGVGKSCSLKKVALSSTEARVWVMWLQAQDYYWRGRKAREHLPDYHAQDGRHPGEAIFCALLAGVGCAPCASKNN